MNDNGYSVGFRATQMAIFCVTVFVTSTWAAAPQGKVLHDFNDDGKDGWNPVSGLVLDTVGNLYGTTAEGGTGGCVNNQEIVVGLS